MKTVFVVDDEIHIRELLEYNLEVEGYRVSSFDSATSMLVAIKTNKPDVIILDIMMPVISGIEACKILRQDEEYKKIPIIILTSKNEEFDKVLGLELGADDYMTKPFSIRELMARIKAMLRRSELNSQTQTTNGVITIKDLTIDNNKREVFKGDNSLNLTFKEFEILKVLVENKGNVLSRDMLLNKIWGYDYFGETRTVDVHIRNIRKILNDEDEKYIETIRGVGYKFKAV